MKRDVLIEKDGKLIEIKNIEVILPVTHYIPIEKLDLVEELINIDFEDYYSFRKGLGFHLKDMIFEEDDFVDLSEFASEFPKYLIKSEESDKAVEENDWEKIISLPHLNPDKPNYKKVAIMIKKLYKEFNKFFIPLNNIKEINSINRKDNILIKYYPQYRNCYFLQDKSNEPFKEHVRYKDHYYFIEKDNK